MQKVTREKLAEAVEATLDDELLAAHTRGAVRAQARRPDCPHRALALEMAALGAPRFVALPWWQHTNPDTGETPKGATVVNRHARRQWYVENRRTKK